MDFYTEVKESSSWEHFVVLCSCFNSLRIIVPLEATEVAMVADIVREMSLMFSDNCALCCKQVEKQNDLLNYAPNFL